MRNILYIFLLGLTVGCSTIPGYSEWQNKRKTHIHNNLNNTSLSLNCMGGNKIRWYKKLNKVKDCYRNGPYFQYHKNF